MADGAGQLKLKGKRALFVDAYLGSAQFNASEAARIAGYANPANEGWRLRRNEDISEAISEALRELKLDEDAALALVQQDALRTDADILTLAAKAFTQAGIPAGASMVSALVSSRTTARTNLLKAHGILTDRLNVKHSGRIDHVHRIPKSIDVLTEDELDKLEAIAERVAAQEVTA